jgi:hypothetical protein
VSIVRAARRQRYTTVDNTPIEDAALSYRALGVLVYVLSKPDHWRTNREQLASAHKEGVAAVRAALTELERAGYIERRRQQGENGRFEWEAVVHEVPAQTIGRFSTDGEAAGGESTALVKTDSAKTEKRSARAPADAGAADHLPGTEPDPQPVERSVDSVAWGLIRGAYDARDRKPIENRQAVAKNVVRLLGAGWREDELERALNDAPAWTPTAIQVELTRGRRPTVPNGRDPSEHLRGRVTRASFEG